MATATISLDYGSYDNFSYKKDASTFELSWEAPDGLEPKYEKIFDASVETAITKMEKELNSGVNEAKKWLAAQDKKIGEVFKKWEKDGCVTKKEAEYCEEIRDMLPDIIENLEKQRVKIFESTLDGILDDAVTDMVKKHKQKIANVKLKKKLKIVGFAVLALAGTALALTTVILTFGAAAGPIIGVCGFAIGTLSTGAGIAIKAKSIWGSGKDEAKNLESAAKAYASATAEFNQVLERQVTYLAAKLAQLDVLDKQIAEAKKHLAKLDTMKKNVGDKLQASIDKAMKEFLALEKAQVELEADVKQHEKLVSDANGKKTYESALALAATLKADRGILDKVSEHMGTVGGLVGGISGAMS